MKKVRPAGSLALFPASFDPVTLGHLDLIRRARQVFDRLVVAVALNVDKGGLFSPEERVALLEDALAGEAGLEVTSFHGLTVDFARQIGSRVVIRGLRQLSDFEYEFEMALMNKHLYPDVETLFMMTSQEFFYVSSSRLKELVRLGRDVDEFVPPLVAKRLREKLRPEPGAARRGGARKA
jgi:pantetheine-phosphate adenylyltransferase